MKNMRETQIRAHVSALPCPVTSCLGSTIEFITIYGCEFITIYGWYTVPPMKGGIRDGWFTVHRCAVTPHGVSGLTSLTLEEFQALVSPFEAAFQAHMATWRLDGKPRTARRFTVYKNCPLPTPEDRLLFILAYIKTYTLQVVQGRLFGMGQSKANQWIHVLLPALLATLHALGDAPARSRTALAQRLGVSEADATTLVAPLEAEPKPLIGTATAPASPLLPMTGPNGASSAPKIAAAQTGG